METARVSDKLYPSLAVAYQWIEQYCSSYENVVGGQETRWAAHRKRAQFQPETIRSCRSLIKQRRRDLSSICLFVFISCCSLMERETGRSNRSLTNSTTARWVSTARRLSRKRFPRRRKFWPAVCSGKEEDRCCCSR